MTDAGPWRAMQILNEGLAGVEPFDEIRQWLLDNVVTVAYNEGQRHAHDSIRARAAGLVD